MFPLKIAKFAVPLLFLTIAAFLGWSYFIEPSMLATNNYDLRIEKWDSALNGYRIATISDIHSGSNNVNETKLREIVKRTNETNPDLILIVGDFVSNSIWDRKTIRMPVAVMAQNLAGFRAKDGVYAVLGNQDDAYDGSQIKSELEKAGIKILDNEVIRIERAGRKIDVVGIPDALRIDLANTPEYTRKSRESLEKLSSEDANLILFTHNPDSIDYVNGDFIPSRKISLLIAGHTHGGQIRFPLIGAPVVLGSSYGNKYAAGHVRDYKTDMFVTTGIGTSVLPLRFGVPPEISVLHLYAAE